jgi:hypothetical protein
VEEEGGDKKRGNYRRVSSTELAPEMGVREIQQETDIGPSTQAPVSNDELGWNWKKPPVGQEPWSAWQKRMGDSDTVRHEFPRLLPSCSILFCCLFELVFVYKADNLLGWGKFYIR